MPWWQEHEARCKHNYQEINEFAYTQSIKKFIDIMLQIMKITRVNLMTYEGITSISNLGASSFKEEKKCMKTLKSMVVPKKRLEDERSFGRMDTYHIPKYHILILLFFPFSLCIYTCHQESKICITRKRHTTTISMKICNDNMKEINITQMLILVFLFNALNDLFSLP